MASVIDDIEPQSGRFRRGAQTQLRVIGALIMRELHTRYGRENIGYLWLILEPLLLAAMIGLIHSRAATHYGSDFKPVPLALVGYCNFMTFRTIVSRSESALEGSSALFYHRSITVFDILFSRALLDAAGTFISFCVLISLAIAVGVAELPARPLYYILAVVLMFWFSFALSMVISGVTYDRKAMGRLIHPLTYVMMPLSGAFFVVSKLPGMLQDFFYWVPLAHIFELFRYGWFSSAKPDFIDPMYLLVWLLAPTLIGLLLISIVRGRIQLG